ncbi:MAG: AmmeMemoRadiSam system protein B [Anaerolineae bacterium]|nr:AmmeMemoRadiSam system protein B [Anaerolineae bacterium]
MADIRLPAVAGMFYPAQPSVLREDIRRYLDAAPLSDLESVRAVVVPHAGYVYSGPVAASAYRLLGNQTHPRTRLLIMGPSHRVWFQGVAVADVDGFRTPLGIQAVDRDYVRRLCADGHPFSAATAHHAAEHSLEVQVPFIQVVLPEAKIVPMLFGDVDALDVGVALNRVVSDDDLLIISSDLSHYHSNETAHHLDGHFLSALLAGDYEGVARGEACGQAPALALMAVADAHGWRPHLLDYRTSGDVTGERRQVVGYAAVAYSEGD